MMRTIKIIMALMFVFTLAACSQGSTVVTSTVSEAAANDAAPTKTEPTIPPTAVPTQTLAPEPTATPEPSATPTMEPTETPEPTATPEPSPTPDLTGGGSGKIIFVSKRDGEEKYYIMNYDGSGQEVWADNPIPNVFSKIPPRYSPDGSQIAISTEKDGTRNIFVANADGSGWQQITHYTGHIVASNPVWSPDGHRIAYGSNDNNGIHIINSDGSDDIPLLNIPSGNKGFPSWSPDGNRIVFSWGYDMVSETYSDSEILVMNADGSDIIPLTENEFQDIAPVWSPDGTKITFHSNRDGNFEIYVMNSDGSEQTRLTDNDVDDFSPMWSPDGRLIVYMSVMQNEDDTRQPELFVMNADGTNLHNLTDGQGGFNPYWLP